MRASLKRFFIVALISFFPLAVIGKMQEGRSVRGAVRYYYLSVIVLIVFLFFLAIYTYCRGGNFIRPMGTFY